MIEFLNKFADLWAWIFGLAIVQNTIFLTLVLFTLFLLRNRSARFRHSVGLIGIVKLLLPPILPISILSALVSRDTVYSATQVFLAPTIMASAIDKAATHLSASAILFLIWIFIAITLIVWAIVSTVRLRVGLMSATPMGVYPEETFLYDSSAQILATDTIRSPLTLGIRRKQIYVPESWYHDAKESRKIILAHEFAHIRRGDSLIKVIQIITLAIYFFHPLVWLLNRWIEQYREMACDDEAVHHAKCRPIDYSKHLVHMAERLVPQKPRFSSAPAFLRQKHELKNRVSYQMKIGTPKQLSTSLRKFIFSSLLLLFILFSWYSSKGELLDHFMNPEVNSLSRSLTDQMFYDYDVPPKPVGGYSKLRQKLDYRSTPVRDGERREVIINVLIDNKGDVLRTEVPRTSNDDRLADAAIDAIHSVKWNPATKQNITVNGWVSLRFFHGPKVETNHFKVIDLVVYDTSPEPINGYDDIQNYLVYPESARKSGIEGTVVIKIQVDETGEVVASKVEKGLGYGCDEAAIAALNAVKWKPAKTEHGQSLKVWVSIPVDFVLE